MSIGIEHFKGNDGKHYFRVKAANGKTIVTSEAYETTQGAARGAIALVRALTPPPPKGPPK